jgi:hypothetical protein
MAYVGVFQTTVRSPVQAEFNMALGRGGTGTGGPALPFLLLFPVEKFSQSMVVRERSCTLRPWGAPLWASISRKLG